MENRTVMCILCEQVVPTDALARSHKPRYFDDVVICPTCLEGERLGHAANAASVRQQLARRERDPGFARDMPGSA